MAISKRSQAIQQLYAEWAQDALHLAEQQEGLEVHALANELAKVQARRWVELVTRLQELVDLCLRLHPPVVQRKVKELLYSGAGDGWVTDLCEQLTPSVSIRDVVKAEVASLLAAIEPASGVAPTPEVHASLLSVWRQLAAHPVPGGSQALLLRDQLVLGLSPLLRAASRQVCRGDKDMAEQVESEVFAGWMEGEVLNGFDPTWQGLENWLLGACWYRRMQVLRANSRYYKLHSAIAVFDDGSQAEPFDPDARSVIGTPIRLTQLKNEAFPLLYADMKKDIYAGKEIVVLLDGGGAKTCRVGFQHLHLLQAAQREQFDPDPGKAKHEELSALTGYSRAKNAEDWRVAQAYVRQHPRAEEFAALLQSSSTPRSLRPPGGPGSD